MTARASLRRIWGLMYRHLALYRRSWPRVLELMYWPVLQMVVWGFVTSYLVGVQGNAVTIAAGVLLGGYAAAAATAAPALQALAGVPVWIGVALVLAVAAVAVAVLLRQERAV